MKNQYLEEYKNGKASLIKITAQQAKDVGFKDLLFFNQTFYTWGTYKIEGEKVEVPFSQIYATFEDFVESYCGLKEAI